MEKIEIDKMETKTTYLEDSMIGGLIGQLAQLDESDSTASEQYQSLRSAIDGRRILNLNGVFRSYTQAGRRRALTLAFRLVDNSSITSLLLEHNDIDAASLLASLHNASLGSSLQNASAVESSSQLSNIKILDLANNSVRKGSGKTKNLSPHARRFPSFLRKNRRVVSHHLSAGKDEGLSTLVDAIKVGCLRSLEHFNLSGSPEIANKYLVSLPDSLTKCHATDLKKLVLRKAGLDDDAVLKLAEAISLGKLAAIEKLDITGNRELTNKSMVLLTTSFQTRHAIHLRKLLLGETNLQEDAVANLAEAISLGKLPALEKLDISKTWGLTNKSGVLLTTSFQTGHTIHLKELVLGETLLQDSAVAKLAEAISLGMLPALEKLDLSRIYWGLTEEAVGMLTTSFQAGHTVHLTDLLLGGTPLHDDAVAKLAETISLGKLPALEKLDLSGAWTLGGNSMVLLTTAFQTGHAIHLRELHLPNQDSQHDAAAQLAKAISLGKLPALEKLDISNDLPSWGDDIDMLCLTSSFKTGNTSHLRHLRFTGIKDDAIIELAKAMSLGKLPALEEVYLAVNEEVTDKSLVQLRASFPTGKVSIFTVNFVEPSYLLGPCATFRDKDLIPIFGESPRMVGKETLKHLANRESYLEVESGLKGGSPVSKFALQSESMLEGQTEFFEDLRENSGDIQDKEFQEPMRRRDIEFPRDAISTDKHGNRVEQEVNLSPAWDQSTRGKEALMKETHPEAVLEAFSKIGTSFETQEEERKQRSGKGPISALNISR